MNANLPQKMQKLDKMNISNWLESAEERLKLANISTARLDAELILAETLNKNRTFLHSNPDKIIHKTQLFHANNWLNKRVKRVPLAYIFGKKEFYGRDFIITKNTLTPRPESEDIIDLYKKIIQEDDSILDVGTGSGILAITAFLESSDFENLNFYASDISINALEIAHNNADILCAKINFLQSNLLEDIPEQISEKLTILVANLPYVDKTWVDQTLPNELHHEPQNALYAKDGGLELVKKLIQQTKKLPHIRHLVLEADPEQHSDIISYAQKNNFDYIEEKGFGLTFKRQY